VRKQDLIPFALLGGVALIIVVQATSMRDTATGSPGSGEEPVAAVAPGNTTRTAGPRTARRDSGTLDTAFATVDTQPSGELVQLLVSGDAPPSRDPETIRGVIRDGAPGTYILDMLLQQDSLVMRWEERRMQPVRVWIERNPELPDWDPGYPLVAEQAFEEWQRAGFPLRFDILPDSANTDIHIRCRSRAPRDRPCAGAGTLTQCHGRDVRGVPDHRHQCGRSRHPEAALHPSPGVREEVAGRFLRLWLAG
jgi:hypothetical protein